MIPRLSIDQSELLAVPAVHNRAVFAEQVNRACRVDSTRPEALAVELSHDTVAAIVAWFKELGVGPGCAGSIPCMLGLVKANRRIHPRHKQAAIRLQELHGLPLHRIPPAVLWRQLNFCPVALLCLTTTDSMIEAIRSAMELDLPVYGIDLGEVANAERGEPMIQDPILAQNGLASYVQRNEAPCVSHRDDVVDGRREYTMAARLKRLLRQYRRVLFTGGLGHWQHLRQRLLDPTFAPATEPAQGEGEHYTRVLVDPALAIRQMDLFPDLTARYESLRQLPPGAAERIMDFAAMYRAKLATAYECAEPENREAAAAFTQYLTNLCVVHQCLVPNLFMTLSAAQTMISPAFASRLGEILVLRALDWARPEQWPNLPYLREIRSRADQARSPNPGQQAALQDQAERSLPFYLAHLSESASHGTEWQLPPLPEFGTDHKSEKRKSPLGQSWVWPPCEALIFGTAYEAADIADRNSRERIPEAFAGSLHDGVDIKATLRAIIRGERRVQVKVRSAPVRTSLSGEEGDEPAVFIFEREQDVHGGRWDTFLASEQHQIRQLVRDPARFDKITREKGHVFIASVHFCANRQPREQLRPHVSHLRYLYGTVLFGSPTLNAVQAARWLEECDYTRCPILRWSGVEELFDHYERQHHISLSHEEWSSSLVRLAFPYAKRRVMVVVPHPQVIPTPLFREASARGIRLELLLLSQFPEERIDAIRHQYLVQPRDVNGLDYSEEIQAAFGEPPDKNIDLLPKRVRAQLDPIT